MRQLILFFPTSAVCPLLAYLCIILNFCSFSLQKQTKGSGVASTVVQSTDQEAAIKAVNTDKFASSLRESAGVQIGVQKDLSVIDAHRRQSQQHHAQTLSGKLNYSRLW